jgi:hypothetical protein
MRPYFHITLRVPRRLYWDLGALICQWKHGSDRNWTPRCAKALKRIRDASSARTQFVVMKLKAGAFLAAVGNQGEVGVGGVALPSLCCWVVCVCYVRCVCCVCCARSVRR